MTVTLNGRGIYFCALCGRERLARRCGCVGARRDVERLRSMAAAHRAAAVLCPASAADNLRDAERLELAALEAQTGAAA